MGVMVGGGGPIWFLLLLGVVLSASLVSGLCTVDVCCCYSDSYNATYQEKIKAFTNPLTPPAFQYTGIKPKGNDVFEPCFCTDVTVAVTVLTLAESQYVTKAADVTQTTSLENEVTTKLNALKGTMTTNETSLQPTLLSLKATYVNHTSSDVVFKVEVLLRGRSEAVSTPVAKSLAVGLAENTLGPVDTSTMQVKVLTCLGEPPGALDNGVRTAVTSYVASTDVVYTCNVKYRLSSGKDKETSTCSPVDTQWTPLPTGLKCEAAPPPDKCAEDPPTPPPLTLSTWNNFSTSEGTEVEYICMDGYSSENDVKASSKCESGEWTSISAVFKCIQTGCLESPPQVPTHGVLDWNLMRANGTVLTYSCNTGFKSNTGENPVVRCVNMTWVDFPEDWACVDEKTKLHLKGALDGADEDELNLFYIVTIPSVGGLIILIICCLCCTRIDSPLFNICNARGPKSAGYTSA